MPDRGHATSRSRWALLCVLALAAGAACTSATRAGEPVPRGVQVYRDLRCGGCHESHFGLPSEAPALDHIGSVAGSRRPGADAATYIREAALKMPGVRGARLPDADIDALVEYLLSRD